jgi:hypothetical protein
MNWANFVSTINYDQTSISLDSSPELVEGGVVAGPAQP